MQDEVNTKVVALTIRVGEKGLRLTASMLKAAMRKYLQSRENAQRARQSRDTTKHGKQTVAQLMKQNTGLTNIEITDKNIKSFERTAQKYNIDFALKRDRTSELPKYVVFFKARDVDVMTAAFKEFSAREMSRSDKPSIRMRLMKYMQQSKQQQKQRVKVRQKDRGQVR